jgi:glutaredoxin
MKHSIILSALLALAVTAPASAEIYRWVDSAGHVHFGDQPPRDVNRVQQLPNQPLPETTDAAKLRETADKKPVTLYTTNCGAPCDQATALLQARGIPFSTKYLDRDPEAVKAYRQLAGQALQVPSLRIGENMQKGFEKVLWNNLLDLAGYPRAKTPAGATPTGSTPQGTGSTGK